ncbi:uncharacterized protein F4812DRAFT_104979 [Daldinia caldariorum]|uniref:uncharacterized protein n=1 Tax=Daldinia caldariorum TaxID=326644 RepID=UPI0020089196|nr:uncharacterized protein F4812DRAFT_104979 [Daldinia caldariorum]KAI1465637.1 hypothetical protein F4812DRAFT_104979 [Daldinia caldariorum]
MISFPPLRIRDFLYSPRHWPRFTNLLFQYDKLRFVERNPKNAILNSGALQPPEGLEPNFDNPTSDVPGASAVFSVCLVLSTIAVLGRLYTRFFLLKQHYISDYILAIGYGFFISEFAFIYKMATVPGLFVHLWDVRWRDFISFLKNVYITSQLYMFSILSIKIAILLEWIHIFVAPGSRGLVYWAAHVTIWINVGFYLSVFVTNEIACTPYEYSWNKLIDGSCERADTHYTNLASCVFNVISDIVILLIPLRVIWGLNMPQKRKVGISVIFSIGFMACAMAILRLVETVQYTESPDYTYTFAGTMLASGAELTCGFLVAGIPSLAKLLSSLDMHKLKRKLSFDSDSGLGRLWHSTRKATGRLYPSQDNMDSSSFRRVTTDQSYLHPKNYNHQTHNYLGSASYSSMPAVEGGILHQTKFKVTESYDLEAVDALPNGPNVRG